MTKAEIIEILLRPLPEVPKKLPEELFCTENFELAQIFTRSTKIKCNYIGSGVFIICHN